MASRSTFFADMLSPRFNPAAVLDLEREGKILIIGDFHMGGGRGDDLEHNGPLLQTILRRYYLEGGWHLVLNGDIEELQRFSLDAVMKKWPEMYRIFDGFAERGRLWKNLGNHDEQLMFTKNYPYELYDAVRIDTAWAPFYVYHGHQPSRIYTEFNTILAAGVRYILKPFHIQNISGARSPRRRFFVEKQAYRFSLANHCVSIIGHTHRTLFESQGRFEAIKYEIEYLCREYARSSGMNRTRVRSEIMALRADLGSLRRRERRDAIRQTLYGDDVPVPCLFNAGCVIGRQGFNAIELERDRISLVYWYAPGAARKFVERGWYPAEAFDGTPFYRMVLNQDRLDYVGARLDLLGLSDAAPPEA